RLRRGKVVVCASIGEEMVEGPMTKRVAQRVQPDAVIICEPTANRVAVGGRGRAELTIEVVGRTGHSSRPDLAVSAAEAMVGVVRALRRVELPRSHPALAPANLVLTDMITGPYPGLSNVPDRCIATYDRRTLPGETESDVLEPIRAALVRGLAGHAG